MSIIQSEHFTQAIYSLLDETFDHVNGHYLDPGDSLFETLATITAAAGGTVGALALGPAINGVLAQSFGQLSRRVATSLGTRIAFAQQGAELGEVLECGLRGLHAETLHRPHA